MERKRSGKRSVSVPNNDEITERPEGADIQFKDDVTQVTENEYLYNTKYQSIFNEQGVV